MEKLSNVKLSGSYKPAKPGEKQRELNKDEVIEVTVRLRRKKELPNESLTGQFLTRETYENDYGASQEDADKVAAFAHANLLTTVEVDLARRSIIFKGKISDFEKAFNVNLNGYDYNAGGFR
ncbi:MAG: family peptidase [Mucilaginibacter sp.]|nr:family peptidase [Mucilaginibacter sp.]